MDLEIFWGLLKVLFFLGILAPLIYLSTRWYGTRFHTSSSMQLKESLSIGSHRALYVVEWEGERLLLGVTAHQIHLLDRKPISLTPDEEGGN